MFYKQEVFLSLMEDTHSMAFVTGRCCVLDYNDYCSREWQETRGDVGGGSIGFYIIITSGRGSACLSL